MESIDSSYTPSTIRGSSHKVLKVFRQHISSKIEPEIYSDWARKPGRKRKTESQQTRFVVATTAALYVCKPGVITSVKIAQTFPWIAIKEFAADDETHRVSITFSTGSIVLVFDDILTVVEKIVSYLRSILPLYFPIKYELPPEFGQTIPLPSARVQIVDIYISKCKEIGQMVDATSISLLRQEMRMLKPFVIDRSVLNENQTEAMSTALMYSPLIKVAKIGGKNFNQLFSRAGSIISLNMGIQDLEIFKFKSSTPQFEYFIRMMQRSAVSKLSFTNVTIDNNMAKFLAQNLVTLPVSALSFDKCHFGKHILDQIYSQVKIILSSISNVDQNSKSNKSPSKSSSNHKNSESNTVDPHEDHKNANFKELSVNNDIIASSTQITKLVRICCSYSLTSIVLVECQLDISEFFKELNNASINCPIALTLIDLSGNRCSPSYTGLYNLPTTLETLRLKRTVWEGKSLLTFMKKQMYMSMVEVDLSRAYFNANSQVTEFSVGLPEEPPSTSIRSLRWDNNPIFVKLLNYLSRLKFLQSLTLNNCQLPTNESGKNLLSALAGLVSRTNLQRFSINKTMKQHGNKLMLALKDTLSQHQTLTRLDLSENEIGDDGLTILKDIVTVNTRISRISFDSCKVTVYSSLVSFLSYVAQLPYLTTVSKPRKEMKRLSEQYGKRVAKEIKAAWARVLEKKAGAQENQHDDSATDCSLSTTSALISSATNEVSTVVRQPLDASWDIQIGAPYDNAVNEWDALEQKFSFASLTGISAIKTVSSDNLIDFEAI
ncbi:hypothetical protein TRFO_01944 [Tritrichomonas foetus]|uniref:Leucine Rich Repeat family protein n=1 Tax=Tritrichomonas foetus TaxID=1144522 RepID=A0A1J4JCP2_9EUKA|nr:hypothetical protein TRFO_01944 [Tritrichomonas foetus]|eukprot:OHS96872.1 hypothetical protein TRFO_01944 [Tritrichomonas foetus]